MANFLDKMKEKIDQGVTTVSVKSNTAVEVSKLKTYIKTLTGQIEQRKAELGQLYYQMHVEGDMNEALLQDVCEAIKVLYSKQEESLKMIEGFKEEEQEILGKKDTAGRCVCGATVEKDAKFCGECGRSIG